MIPDLDRRLYLATAYGTPAPQGSKSVDRRGVMYEQNRNARPWRKLMVDTFKVSAPADPIDEVVEIRATFTMPRPKRPKFAYGHGVKPDVDKLQRNLGDALQEAGVLRDDSRIAEWHVRKVYAASPASARVTVEVLKYSPASWPLLHVLPIGESTLDDELRRVLEAVERGDLPADGAHDELHQLLDLDGVPL